MHPSVGVVGRTLSVEKRCFVMQRHGENAKKKGRIPVKEAAQKRTVVVLGGDKKTINRSSSVFGHLRHWVKPGDATRREQFPALPLRDLVADLEPDLVV
jgi:hypothetical protein